MITLLVIQVVLLAALVALAVLAVRNVQRTDRRGDQPYNPPPFDREQIYERLERVDGEWKLDGTRVRGKSAAWQRAYDTPGVALRHCGGEVIEGQQ